MTLLGDLMYGGSSPAGSPTRLAGDTSNIRKFLRQLSSGGVATAEVWDTLVAGDINTLAPVKLSSGSLSGSSLNLTGLTGYSTYELSWFNAVPTANNVNLGMRVSTNGGSSYATTNYAWSFVYANQVGGAGGGGSSGGVSSTWVLMTNLANTAAYGTSGFVRFSMGTASLRPMAQAVVHAIQGAGAWASLAFGGFWDSTGPINAVQFYPDTTTFAAGSYTFYGIP
jgi:hypothetical protein